MNKLTNIGVHIDETPGLNPLELRSKARRLLENDRRIGTYRIDYIQLMSANAGEKTEQRKFQKLLVL